MTELPSRSDFADIKRGYDANASRTMSLRANAYTDPCWHNVDLQEIIAKTWQWVCHVEKLRTPGDFIALDIAGQPIAVVRDREGTLRAFYNAVSYTHLTLPTSDLV